MKQLGFYVDAAKCSGCKTCQMACKDKNDLEVGRNYRKVIEYAGGKWKKDKGAWTQNVFAYYTTIACNECAEPACTKVCPTGAHAKRGDNGLVLIDRPKCIGCRMCEKACPYGVPQFEAAATKMTKCDACIDRLANGMQPSCIDSCPQRALEFGDVEELRRKYGRIAAIAPLPDEKETGPSLVIRPPRNARPVGDKSGTVYA
jgi:anaerobic dimethyl sulfoxide reductase subunit B